MKEAGVTDLAIAAPTSRKQKRRRADLREGRGKRRTARIAGHFSFETAYR